jgi:hypothetical protein
MSLIIKLLASAARELFEESLAVARKFGDRWSTAMSLTMVGHVDLADGDHARRRPCSPTPHRCSPARAT